MAVEIYACIVGRSQRHHCYMFNISPEHSDIELAYPFWVVIDDGKPTLVDIGFSEEVAAKRGIFDYRAPADVLARIGLTPNDIETVAISHLHYDHFQGPDRFPNATFVVQSDDVDYFTGRGAAHPAIHGTDGASLAQLDGLRRSGRLRIVAGDHRLNSHMTLVHVGGHTPGSQITVVDDGRSRTVLACDASHFYANLERRTPTALIHSYDDYQRGFATIEALAHEGRWFPGHDPQMLEKMERVADGVYRA